MTNSYDADQAIRRAQRQIKVGLLAQDGHTAQDIANTLGISRALVYSDLDAMDMRNVVRRRRTAVCGTTGGYYAHRRRKEAACQPCRDAANQADRQRRAQRAKENADL